MTNLYGYVLNNPINFWDPWGLEFSYWGMRDQSNDAKMVLGSSGGIAGFSMGWDTSNPYKQNASFTPTQLIGGGWHFIFKNDSNVGNSNTSGGCSGLAAGPVWGEVTSNPIIWNLGLGEFLGVSFADDLSYFSINVGFGIALPGPSIPLETGNIIQDF